MKFPSRLEIRVSSRVILTLAEWSKFGKNQQTIMTYRRGANICW